MESRVDIFINQMGLLIEKLAGNSVDSLDILKMNEILFELNGSELKQSITGYDISIKWLFDQLIPHLIVENLVYFNNDINWFLLNCYLNDYIRSICPKVKLMWEFFSNLYFQDANEEILDSLIESCFLDVPSKNWAYSNILLSIADDPNFHTLVVQKLNNRIYKDKFHHILQLNNNISNVINLIHLFIKLRLESEFLPNFSYPVLTYIELQNPIIKNGIPCFIMNQILHPSWDLSNCIIQPVETYLLILWVQCDNDVTPVYINLPTLKSISMISNSGLKLKFICDGSRQLRSSVSFEKYIHRYSIKYEREKVLLDTELEIEIKDDLHYTWLIKYLTRIIQERRVRKVSTCYISTVQVPSSIENNKRKKSEAEELNETFGINEKDEEIEEITSECSLQINELDSEVKTPSIKKVKIGKIMKSQMSASQSQPSNFVRRKPPLITISQSENMPTLDFHDFSPNHASTPKKHEYTDLMSTTHKTSIDEYDMINESMKLYSSSLVNKLKVIEFDIIRRRNQLQQELDQEMMRIEQKQKTKLQQISKYLQDELNKIK